LKPVIAFGNISDFELKLEAFNLFEFFLQPLAQVASGFAVQNQSHHNSKIKLDLKFSNLRSQVGEPDFPRSKPWHH
jgi:hypothetical protein